MADEIEKKNDAGPVIESVDEIVDVRSQILLKNDDDPVIKPIEEIVEVRSQILSINNEMMPAGPDSLEENTVNAQTTLPIITTLRGKKTRSASCAHSRDPQKCQTHFRKMVDKRGTRNEELEQRQGDLRKRLDMLEVSMPAVMVWNILRMTQGVPPSALQSLMKKQFQAIRAASNIVTMSTPSQHYDFRVREIDAARKEALRRADEARASLAEKEAVLKERQKDLEDAKKYNQDKKECVERLNSDAAEMRLATKNASGDARFYEIGECCEISSKGDFFHNVDSLSSIGSQDLERFIKLEELAVSEVCMKRQINELERREEAYMRTIQQADELWYKIKGDAVSTVTEMQEQLNLKATANQQLADRICHLEDELERSMKGLIGCKEALKTYTNKEYVDVAAGFEDNVAGVADCGIVAAIETATALTGVAPDTVDVMINAYPEMMDQKSSIAPEYTDEGSSVRMKTFDKGSEAAVDSMEKAIDISVGLGINVGIGETRIDGFGDEETPEELKDCNWDEGCPPNVVCNDVVESSTETGGFQSLKPPFSERRPNDTMMEDKRLSTKVFTDGNTSEIDPIIISREELRNSYNIVYSAHHTISKRADCSSKIDSMAQLADKMRDLSVSLSKSPLAKISTGIGRDLNTQAIELGAGTPVLHPSTTQMDIKPMASTDEYASLNVKASMILSAEKLQGINFPNASSALVTLGAAKPLKAFDEIPETTKSRKYTMKERFDVPEEVRMVGIVEPITLENGDIGKQSLTQSIDAKILENVGHLSEHGSAPSAISKKVVIEEDVRDEMIDFSKEPEVRTEQSLSQPKITVDVPTEDEKTKPPVTAVSEMLFESIAEGRTLEEDGKLDESNALLIISRTSALFEPDIHGESKELLPSMVDLKDDSRHPSSTDLIPALVPLAETKIQTDVDELVLIKDVIEEIIEEIVGTRPVLSPEILEISQSQPEAVSKPKGERLEEPSNITVATGELGTITVPLAVEDKGAIKAKLTSLAYTVPLSDREILEITKEKLLEKIPTDETQMEICERERYESDVKLTLPDSVGPSICKLSPLHLPEKTVCSGQKLKIPKQDTEGTQTLLQFPRTLDKLKLKMITGSTWPSADVVMWRRPLVWSRRPRDKSTLTTVCVDTQTDTAFVPEKTTHQRIQRKNNCTCTGVAPIKTNVDGYREAVSSCNTDKRSTASIIEKEISPVKYTGKCTLTTHSDLHCAECGRTMTSEDLPLKTNSNRRTNIKVDNSLTGPVKNISSLPTSRMGQKQNESTCCKCEILTKTGIKNEARKKKELQQHFNSKMLNTEICYPCPSDDAEKKPIKSPKSSRKSRKPERKNQSVMAYVPTSKCKQIKAIRTIDASETSAKNKTEELPNNQCTLSGIGSSNTLSPWVKYSGSLAANFSDTKSTTEKARLKSDTTSNNLVAKVGGPKEALQCTCDENGSVHVPYTKYSSIFRLNISKEDSAHSNEINKTSRKNLDRTCHDSTLESLSLEACNSNCTSLRK